MQIWTHSVAGQLEFQNAVDGDFTVVGSQVPFQIGFENFPMDRFGVYSSHLKTLAEKPIISPLIMNDTSDSEKEYEWLDGTVRAIKGLGDRFAYGLPDETGVVVVSIQPKSVLLDSGIQKGDVIRSINGIFVKTVHDLFTITDKEKWKSNLVVILFRNQQMIKENFLLKR